MLKRIKWPAERVVNRPVERLKPYEANARKHSPEQVEQIAKSIGQWGFTQPVLIDEKGGIIAGHGRVLAAKKLGLTEVPVVVARGWTAAQKRAYALADNQIALNAEWDEGLLMSEFGSLSEIGFDLELLGFAGNLLEPEVFSPALEPEMDTGKVTDADILKKREELREAYKARGEQTIIDVTCPHCGHAFGVNRDLL